MLWLHKGGNKGVFSTAVNTSFGDLAQSPYCTLATWPRMGHWSHGGSIHLHTYACMRARAHTHTHTHTLSLSLSDSVTHMHAPVPPPSLSHSHTHTHTHTHTHMCMHTHTHVCTRTHTHTRAHAHTQSHIHSSTPTLPYLHQLGLAGVLFVAELASMRHGGDRTNGLGERGPQESPCLLLLPVHLLASTGR